MGGSVGFGSRPALLVVDMTYGFVDSAYPLGHGETGWPAVCAIREVLRRARDASIPVIYTVARRGASPRECGRWKGGGAAGDPHMGEPRPNTIVEEVAPVEGETVIAKTMPSAFVGSELLSQLVYDNIDTLILTGMVTSGCVRATAIDAFSRNLRVIIPQECVADRGQTSHKAALFELHMKYADVLPATQVSQYLSGSAGERRTRAETQRGSGKRQAGLTCT